MDGKPSWLKDTSAPHPTNHLFEFTSMFVWTPHMRGDDLLTCNWLHIFRISILEMQSKANFDGRIHLSLPEVACRGRWTWTRASTTVKCYFQVYFSERKTLLSGLLWQLKISSSLAYFGLSHYQHHVRGLLMHFMRARCGNLQMILRFQLYWLAWLQNTKNSSWPWTPNIISIQQRCNATCTCI